MKNIKINNIIKTSYEDGLSWIEYTFKDENNNTLIGYDLIFGEYSEEDEKDIEKLYNSIESLNLNSINKAKITTIDEYLAKIIEECRTSENEMWFVEFNDLKECVSKEKISDFINRLKNLVNEISINNYIKFNEYGYLITVYGGIITKFLF